MALQIGNAFWKRDNAGALVAADPADIGKYLADELGYSAADNYSRKAVTALTTPAVARTNYNNAMLQLWAQEGTRYAADVQRISTLGLSKERAEEIAKQNSRVRVASEMKIIDLEHPLMRNDSVMATAAAKAGTQISITNPFKLNEAFDEEKYIKYRDAYKSAKGKSKSKSKSKQ